MAVNMLKYHFLIVIKREKESVDKCFNLNSLIII